MSTVIKTIFVLYTQEIAMADVSIKFLCGLRGYYEYCSVWRPVQDEILCVQQERNNPYDPYAVAALKQQRVVGHLPREISRFTWFIISHGTVVSVKVVDIHQRRSPLVQGGLEIPVEVYVAMQLSDENQKALDIYRSLIHENYEEPVNGNFPDVTAAVLADLETSSESDTEDEDEEQN